MPSPVERGPGRQARAAWSCRPVPHAPGGPSRGEREHDFVDGTLAEPEQTRGVAAQDLRLGGRLEAELAGDDGARPLVGPVEAEVAAENHALGAHAGDQPAERLRRVADRVV